MKRVNKFMSAAALSAIFTVGAFAQDTTTVVKNPDGTYTVIEYPVGKEVSVNLLPGSTIVGAKGMAKILRAQDGTKIMLDLNSVGDSKRVYAYAVDPNGATRFLGPVDLASGAGKAEFSTDLGQFMLVLSPNEGVTTWNDTTPVFFRSEIPQGYAVVPRIKTADTKAVAATNTVQSPYQVPLLNVPGFAGKTTEIRINFNGELTGLKGKAYIDPGAQGTTQIKMRFDDMKQAPKEKRFVLWASSPTGEYTKLGQVINTGERQESEIRSETALLDFGLFVTVEEADVTAPTSKVYSVFGRQ